MASDFSDFLGFIGDHPNYAIIAIFLLAWSEAVPVIGTNVAKWS
jgi:hypothetical protein